MKLRLLIILAFVSVLIVPGYIFGCGGGGGAPPPDAGKTETKVSEFISLPGGGAGGKATPGSEWGLVVETCKNGTLITKSPLASGSSGKGMSKDELQAIRERRNIIRGLISGFKRKKYTEDEVITLTEKYRQKGIFTTKEADIFYEVLDIKTDSDERITKIAILRGGKIGEVLFLHALLRAGKDPDVAKDTFCIGAAVLGGLGTEP